MTVYAVSDVLTFAEPLICAAALTVIFYRKQLGRFGVLSAFLALRILSSTILLPIYYLSKSRHPLIEPHIAYKLYFYVYWPGYAIEAFLGFWMIYSLYKMAMEPLPGLQRLGIIMFRWVGGIAAALAFSLAIIPGADKSVMYIPHMLMQLQQTRSVLTLCLLFFVCLAAKPMGLSYRSKIFGVSLGLGILASTDLVSMAWFSSDATLYSFLQMTHELCICSAFAVWFVYFLLPEPKRRMIVLPTTSPFLRWNQISMVLGDEPGFVAVGEVTVDMFAPAEVEIMRRASAKMSRPLLTEAS